MRHREEPKPCHKGVQSRVVTVVQDGSSGSQEQETAPQGHDEVATMAEQGGLAKCDLRPLGKHTRSVRNRASELARYDLRPLGRSDRNLMNKVFSSGLGTSRSSRQW